MNDARNRLRSMGGIMASSPELMQAAAQRFNAGGLAMTTAPMAPVRPATQYNDMMRPPMEPPVVGLGRVTPVRPLPPVRPASLPGFEEDIIGELIDGSRAGFSLPQFAPGSEFFKLLEQEQAEEEAKDVAGAQRIQQRKQETVEDLKAQLERAPDVQKPAIQRRIDELQGELTTGQTTGMPLTVDEVTLPPQPAGVDDDRKAAATEQRFKDLVPQRAQEDPAEAEKIAQDAMSVLLKTQPGTGEGDGASEPKEKTLRDYYNDARSLISEVYGEQADDDDGVDNRMMDLAMIGLAIAAGQSPNALSNIAQGLLVGTQGMAQRREAERDRAREQERAERTLALETAIAQQGAATEAEAEAARMEVEQQNKLELEREKARLQRGSSGSSGYEAVPRVAEQAITTINALREGVAAGSIRIPDQYKENPEAFITNERNKEMLNYIEGLGVEGQIKDPRRYAALGQMYMYRDVDPEDPEAGQFPVVRSERELGFILPGQSYLKYNSSTGKYTRETKPVSE